MQSFASSRAIGALVLREMATTYGRTPGGYIWALLEPMAAVALLSWIFALAFDSPPLGRSFALFYATGYLPFAFYSDLAQKIGVAMRFSKPLLSYPALTWADTILARFLLNAFTHFGIILCVLVVICTIEGVVPANILLCAAGIALGSLCGMAFGTLNTFLFEAFPVWERIWAILNRPAFIVSGVLFLPDSVPEPFDDLVWLNPLVHAISVFRSGVYSGYQPATVDPYFATIVPAAVLVVGLVCLSLHARSSMWLN